jgi:putative hydrolase of the HAD superfamily
MPRDQRRFEWVFLDAGDTLFRVATALKNIGPLLAPLGHFPEYEQVKRAVIAAREASSLIAHVGPGPDFAVSAERAVERRARFLDVLLDRLEVPARRRDEARERLVAAFTSPDFFRRYPDVDEALAELRARGFRLGIVSNWDPSLELLCANHGLPERVEFVVASESEGFAKPGPALFQRALALAGVTPERVVHVGDSYEHDVVGASGLGIQAVLLDRGGYYTAATWRPTVRSLAELPALLEGELLGLVQAEANAAEEKNDAKYRSPQEIHQLTGSAV